jgi:hypothetical protein
MARAAYSLNVLLQQLNNLAPNRNKASDGWIGDPAHAARKSDHNPDSRGIVHARDYTHDPQNGVDCNWLAKALTRWSDPRIKYIIWDRGIWTPATGWKNYSGSNAHIHHLHLSVNASNADSNAPWQLFDIRPIPVIPDPEEIDMSQMFYVQYSDGVKPYSDAIFACESNADGLTRRHLHPNEWHCLQTDGARVHRRPHAWIDSIPWGKQPGLEPWKKWSNQQ